MENPNYENKNIEIKYAKEQFFRITKRFQRVEERK